MLPKFELVDLTIAKSIVSECKDIEESDLLLQELERHKLERTHLNYWCIHSWCVDSNTCSPVMYFLNLAITHMKDGEKSFIG